VQDNNTPFKRDVRRLAENAADVAIARNKKDCAINGKVFGVNRQVLMQIFIDSYQLTDISDPVQRTAYIASRIAVDFITRRPFAYFNRSTAFDTMADYVESQGFVLAEEDKRNLYSMLKGSPSRALVEANLRLHLRPE
jgi:hypothetical protein